MAIFIASSIMLAAVILRNKMSWSWLRGFALHFVFAAALLYVLNYSGLIAGMHIPLNPVTIGTVVTLGVPGIALIMGLQWVVV